MNYEYLLRLRQAHPAWRLLSADHAPFICGFLHCAFIASNIRAYAHADLVARLDDYLFHLRQSYGEQSYPRTAAQYLETWAHPENAYLRKYYPAQRDEPEWDLTPATEKALTWLESLRTERFVGTESRLMTIFELLRALILATDSDRLMQIELLQRQRAEIDAELAHLASGGAIVPKLSPTQIRERFYQAEDTARRLLADFRQVEANFRDLDRATRENNTLSDQSKSALLTEIFGEHDAISGSDQGKSFRAFWAFLMSPERQEGLQTLVARATALPELAEPQRTQEVESLLPQLKFHLLDAGEKVQRTAAQLVEQLRRFLDSQLWLENKRIAELVHGIEQAAVAVRENPPCDVGFGEVPAMQVSIATPFTRSLFVPPKEWRLIDAIAEMQDLDLSAESLFDRPYVDTSLLRGRIDAELASRAQISLAELIERYPLQQDIAELVTYVYLATRDERAMISDDATQTILCPASGGAGKRVTLPLVIYCR